MSRRAWEAAQGLAVGDGTRVGKRVTEAGEMVPALLPCLWEELWAERTVAWSP